MDMNMRKSPAFATRLAKSLFLALFLLFSTSIYAQGPEPYCESKASLDNFDLEEGEKSL